MWHKTKVNVDDKNGQHLIHQCELWKEREFQTILLKNGIIKIFKLIVNLIMSGFSGKSKRILFASDPILVQGFAYNMVQYVMAGCQNE